MIPLPEYKSTLGMPAENNSGFFVVGSIDEGTHAVWLVSITPHLHAKCRVMERCVADNTPVSFIAK